MRTICFLTLCTLFIIAGYTMPLQGSEPVSVSQDEGPEPVLSVGDFDGSGEVTENDVMMVEAQVESADYIAFFDRNADSALDQEDIEITRAEIGMASQIVDQELAMLFHNTKQYRDQERAIEAGFMPFTNAVAGHGEHWGRHPNTGGVGYAFQPANPVGLNYDEAGRLWAVFYYLGMSPTRPDGTKYPPRDEFRPLMEPPEGFTGDRDHWHFHAGACFGGVNYDDPTLNAAELNFRQGISPSECLPKLEGEGEVAFFTENVRWAPKFHMLHAWIYELNPDGTFAETHPRLSQDAIPEEATMPHGKVDTFDAHPDYPFEGGTLCAWLAEADMAPEFCSQGNIAGE